MPWRKRKEGRDTWQILTGSLDPWREFRFYCTAAGNRWGVLSIGRTDTLCHTVYPDHSDRPTENRCGRLRRTSRRSVGGSGSNLGCWAQASGGEGAEKWSNSGQTSKVERMGCGDGFSGVRFIDHMFSFKWRREGGTAACAASTLQRASGRQTMMPSDWGGITGTGFTLAMLGLQYLCNVCSRSRFRYPWEQLRSISVTLNKKYRGWNNYERWSWGE